MKPNLKIKVMIIIALGIVFGLSPIISNGLIFDTGKSDESNFDNKNLKISVVSGKIHIDNNWTAAKAAGICTGDGTYSERYVIEDLVIDGGGSGSCILIENSDVYFKIENCTVYNSGEYWGDSGIRLIHVDNSQLINNNCSDNYYFGIYLYYSDNNTLSGNTASNNIYRGISLDSSDNNIISGNTVNNSNVGISLDSSDNNIISGNTINNNYHGIFLYNSDNIISFNTITRCSFGIYLKESNSNEISNNVFSDNGEDIKNATEEFFLWIVITIVISTVIVTIVVTGVLIRKRRRSKDEVAKFYRLKGQEKQLKDGVELNDK